MRYFLLGALMLCVVAAGPGGKFNPNRDDMKMDNAMKNAAGVNNTAQTARKNAQAAKKAAADAKRLLTDQAKNAMKGLDTALETAKDALKAAKKNGIDTTILQATFDAAKTARDNAEKTLKDKVKDQAKALKDKLDADKALLKQKLDNVRAAKGSLTGAEKTKAENLEKNLNKAWKNAQDAAKVGKQRVQKELENARASNATKALLTDGLSDAAAKAKFKSESKLPAGAKLDKEWTKLLKKAGEDYVKEYVLKDCADSQDACLGAADLKTKLEKFGVALPTDAKEKKVKLEKLLTRGVAKGAADDVLSTADDDTAACTGKACMKKKMAKIEAAFKDVRKDKPVGKPHKTGEDFAEVAKEVARQAKDGFKKCKEEAANTRCGPAAVKELTSIEGPTDTSEDVARLTKKVHEAGLDDILEDCTTIDACAAAKLTEINDLRAGLKTVTPENVADDEATLPKFPPLDKAKLKAKLKDRAKKAVAKNGVKCLQENGKSAKDACEAAAKARLTELTGETFDTPEKNKAFKTKIKVGLRGHFGGLLGACVKKARFTWNTTDPAEQVLFKEAVRNCSASIAEAYKNTTGRGKKHEAGICMAKGVIEGITSILSTCADATAADTDGTFKAGCKAALKCADEAACVNKVKAMVKAAGAPAPLVKVAKMMREAVMRAKGKEVKHKLDKALAFFFKLKGVAKVVAKGNKGKIKAAFKKVIKRALNASRCTMKAAGATLDAPIADADFDCDADEAGDVTCHGRAALDAIAACAEKAGEETDADVVAAKMADAFDPAAKAEIAAEAESTRRRRLAAGRRLAASVSGDVSASQDTSLDTSSDTTGGDTGKGSNTATGAEDAAAGSQVTALVPAVVAILAVGLAL